MSSVPIDPGSVLFLFAPGRMLVYEYFCQVLSLPLSKLRLCVCSRNLFCMHLLWLMVSSENTELYESSDKQKKGKVLRKEI